MAVAIQEDNQNGVTMRDTAGSLRADAPGHQPCGTLVGIEVTHSLRADGFDAPEDGTGRGTPLVPCWPAEIALTLDTTMAKYMGYDNQHVNAGCPLFVPSAMAIRTAQTGSNGWGIGTDEQAYTLDGAQQAVCFNLRGREDGAQPEVADAASVRAASGGSSRSYVVNGNSTPEVGDDLAFPLRADDGSGNRQALKHGMAVRRLTPRECERLQGFKDDYTLIPWRGKPACDGPRYKAIGNSMAAPVMRWIGERIQAVEELSRG